MYLVMVSDEVNLLKYLCTNLRYMYFYFLLLYTSAPFDLEGNIEYFTPTL